MAIQYQDQKEIVKLYLMGENKTALAKRFATTYQSVKKVIEDPELRLEIEKRYLALQRSKENRVITEIKGDAFEYIRNAISEASGKEGKIAFIKEITASLSTLDNIGRLNAGEATVRTENTNKNYDVAKILNELKSPEEKMTYLRNQVSQVNE